MMSVDALPCIPLHSISVMQTSMIYPQPNEEHACTPLLHTLFEFLTACRPAIHSTHTHTCIVVWFECLTANESMSKGFIQGKRDGPPVHSKRVGHALATEVPYASVCVYQYVCMYACTCHKRLHVCVYVCIHTHTHTHTHTHANSAFLE
jgi:hypothetical protein